MGCRCSEIARCQHDLTILSGSVASDVSSANNDSTQISQMLVLAAGSVVEAVNTDTIYDVEAALNIVNQRGNELSQNLCNDCSFEIHRLSVILAQMRSEDHAHHEAERARAAKAAKSSK